MIALARPSAESPAPRPPSYFARFLQDFDGILPAPWFIDPETGSFMRGSRNIGFRIKELVGPPRPSGGGSGVHPTGNRCPGTFRVLGNDSIGKLRLRRGPYRVTLLSDRLSCKAASRLFAAFLDDTDGVLARPWVLNVQHRHVHARARRQDRLPHQACALSVLAAIGPLAADTGRGIGISGVDEGSFLTLVAVAALAALTVSVLGRRIAVPVVVVEIVLGIVIGPEVLGLAEPDEFTQFFSNLGLGMLFFFAGYEIDFQRIRGKPLRLAAFGWLLSLALAFGLGGLLAAAGVVLSLRFTGSAAGDHGHRHPDPDPARRRRAAHPLRHVPARRRRGGGVRADPAHHAVALHHAPARHRADPAGLHRRWRWCPRSLAVRSVSLGWGAPRGNPRDQRPAGHHGWPWCSCSPSWRWPPSFGLDLLLGGFVAGIITRLAVHGREVARFESKLIAVGYGFFIPFFFVFSGVTFDLDAVVGSVSGLLKLPLFVAMFLIVRGLPALLLYRGGSSTPRDRLALAVLSATQLPARRGHHHGGRGAGTHARAPRPRRSWARPSSPR